jgi:hemolysin activation/secretion protein
MSEVLLAQVLPINPAVTSNNPAATQQREKENRERLEERRRLQQRPDESPIIDVPNAIPALDSEDDESNLTFMLNALDFSKSEWLSKAELSELSAPYVGTLISFSSLNDIINDINQYYRTRNILTAQAILPPQKITNGVVKITLVEGRIGKVIVTDNTSTATRYITSRVNLNPDELIRINELEKSLMRFNRVEDIQLRAQMEKGSDFGKTDIQLKVVEPPTYEVELFLSNTGTDETGETRGGFSFTNNSLVGYRDRLTFSALGSSGSEGYVFGYNIAINEIGGRLGFNYLKDDLDIDSEFFTDINIDAASNTRSVDFTQPIFTTNEYSFRFSTAIEDNKSSSSLDGIVVQSSEVESMPLIFEWDQYFDSTLLFASASLVRGRERQFDERYFTSYRSNLTYLYSFYDDFSLVTRFAGQFSDDDNLPGSQVFQIGGASTVRGYEEGLLTGDKGAFANIELQWNLSKKFETSIPLNFSPFIFLDQGVVYPFRPDASIFAKKEFLGSVGTGLSFALTNMLSGAINIGFPVREDYFDQDGSRIHFNLSYRP